MGKRFIALDWGTSSFRAYIADAEGLVEQTVSAPEGILAVTDGNFEQALERHIGGWDKSLPVLAAGMITSRQGWIELPYVPCPAGPEDLARALHHHITASGRRIAFSTGLSYRHPDGMPEVMRSEETQVFGALDDGATEFVTPGTHSKWITAGEGRITRYTTYVTGEVFAALKNHTILGRLMIEAPPDDGAFADGVRAALADPSGFLHRIFAARSRALFGELPAASIASYLSGQVIGSEVAHALAQTNRAAEHLVLASPAIGNAYVQALAIVGLKARLGDPAVIVKGLARIARAAQLLD